MQGAAARHRGGPQTGRAGANGGVMAHRLGGAKGGLENLIDQTARQSVGAGMPMTGFDLAQHLALADHLAVQSGGDAKHMLNRRPALAAAQIGGHLIGRHVAGGGRAATKALASAAAGKVTLTSMRSQVLTTTAGVGAAGGQRGQYRRHLPVIDKKMTAQRVRTGPKIEPDHGEII